MKVFNPTNLDQSPPPAEPLYWNGLIEEHFGLESDGPLEVLRDPTWKDTAKHIVAVGTITLAEVGVSLGRIHPGIRVFESDHRGLPLPSTDYKLNTMRDLTEKERAHHTALRAAGLFIKGLHDKDSRTKVGGFLAETGLDEIPGAIIHLLTGELRIFGKGRQLMAEEWVGEPMMEVCRDLGHKPIEVSRNISSGLANQTAVLMARIMDKNGLYKFVRATMTPDSKLATKIDRLKATTSHEFRSQTSSVVPAEDRPRLRRRASDRARQHMTTRTRTKTKQSHQERVG